MRKIALLAFLLSITLGLAACAFTETADKVTIHTENGSVLDFKSEKATLTKTKDITKLQNRIEKCASNKKYVNESPLVGATTYTIKMYTNDQLTATYALYGKTLTHYTDPQKDKVRIYNLTTKQQKQLQQNLNDYLQ